MNSDIGVHSLRSRDVYPCRFFDGDEPVDADLGKTRWRNADVRWFVPTAAPLCHEWIVYAERQCNPVSFWRGEWPERQTNAPPYYRTAFAAVWSPTHLFLGFRCEDPSIVSGYSDRDKPLYLEDVVEAFVCPTGDLHRYYELELSPRGVVFDATVASPTLHRDQMVVDTGWDCPGLITAVQTHQRGGVECGWSAELAIPFAAFPEAGVPEIGTEWMANFYRVEVAGEVKFTALNPTFEEVANFHVPQRFCRLEFGE